MAKALMIQGTGSGAGKSLITAALCRIFRDEGIRVAPFKAQNMALNSFITEDCGEIGRAQALQAEAAGLKPTTDMNPILLKASGEMGSQVIIQGRVLRHMKAREYYAFKQEAWKAVRAAYNRLAKQFDLIIMEGAGSPAEINLMNVDIVNMSAAKLAKAPVILVGDIDKGGVFASLYGTVKLLGRDQKHIRGFIINKFRGDLGILQPGFAMIEKKTSKPVIGVLPYINTIGLPEEDGLALGRREASKGHGPVKIVVVRLRYISNFTDFDPFFHEHDVELVYSANPADIETADLVIVPGSKNTVKDLVFLRETGLDMSILRAYEKGIRIAGICGGYQMLGGKISDPLGVETNLKEVKGLGLLNIETVFGEMKTTCQAEAGPYDSSGLLAPELMSGLRGYEIHMGDSHGDVGLFRIKRFLNRDSLLPETVLDGSVNGRCWGTYLHGIFDNNEFRRALLNQIRQDKGLQPIHTVADYHGQRSKALDDLAQVVRDNVDIHFVRRIIAL